MKTTLFKKLYQNGKQIIKNWSLANIERMSMIKLQSSIAATKNEVYDLIEKQKQMLCDIEKFDHVEFAKLTKQLMSKQQDLEILNGISEKLFGVSDDIYIEWNVREILETTEQTKESKE